MGSFGQSLRTAREVRGISLDDIAGITKIRTEYLVAIENDDFESLPDGVFGRGFLRAYAEVVGLDPEAAIAACAVERRAHGIEETPQVENVLAELDRLIPEKASAAGQQRRLLAVGCALGLLAIVGLASWRMLGPGASDPTPRPVVETAQVAPPVIETVQVAPPVIEPPVVHETVQVAPPVVEPSVVANSEAQVTTLSVAELAIGRGVAGRRIIDPGDSFDEGQTVWFWTRVEGAERGDRIRHVWLHDGQEVHAIDLELGAATWRTQSAKKMWAGSRGDWRVEARDDSGRVLAASTFVCR